MQYDPSGRLTQVAVDGGAATTYAYDAHGRLQSVEHGDGEFLYAYTGASPFPASLTHPSGVTTHWTYDGLRRVSEIVHRDSSLAVLSRYAYTHDIEGRRTSETIEDGLTPSAAVPRLTTSQFDEVNELLSSSNPPRAYGYDADGNPTSGHAPGGEPFAATYDPEQHLTSLEYTDGAGHVRRSEYAHDGDGWLARIVERDNGAVTRDRRFVRGPRLFLEERDGSGAVVAEYAWDTRSPGGVGGLLKRRKAGQDHSYLYDAEGNVTGVVDAAQDVAAAYRYDPFGRIEAESGSLAQDFRFSTKLFETGTGLSHFGFRLYAPGSGRWMTRDPLRERGGPNLYAYLDGDPLNRIDPWGLDSSAGTGGRPPGCEPPPPPPPPGDGDGGGGCGGKKTRKHAPHGFKYQIGRIWMSFSCFLGVGPGDPLGQGDTPNATAGVRG
jgi:RHS repeat-associated protein